MARALVLAMLPVLASAGPAQDRDFESPEFGLRLKVPAKWTFGSSTPPEILKISLPGDHPFKPEVVIHNHAFTEEHITLSQYREQFRQFIQRSYRDPRILDDRELTVGGKKAIVFTTASRAKGDAPAVSYKGLIELSPMRMISIECIAPRSIEEEASKSYEALLASIEFFPRKAPEGSAEGVKKFAEAVAKLPATEASFERKAELEYVVGDRNLGSYSQEMRAATREGAAGLETTISDIIDLGAEGGRLEKRTKAFVSDDLAKQRADVEIIHRNKDQRTQYFTASVALNGTEVTAERRINGEKVTSKLSVPQGTVLMELLEPVQFRLLAGGKSEVLSVPVLPAFDNETGHVKMEHRGEYEMKSPQGGGLTKVTEFVVGREDGSVITYWFDPERKQLRRAVGGQNVILQAKK